jgi:hypothetical protein
VRTAHVPNGSLCSICLPSYVYQYSAVLNFDNGPYLNAEIDSCTFISNTAGSAVSNFRIAFSFLPCAA